jgi:hypothetical protein
MDTDTYPILAFIGVSAKTHAAWSTNPDDFAYETFCGRSLRYHEVASAAPGEPVTCKVCRRSLSGRRATGNHLAGRTLRYGQEYRTMTATTAPPPTLTDAPEYGTEYVRAWRVSSRRHPHVTYTVTYDRLENEWGCQCPGWWKWGHCWHVDTAINALTAEWRRAKRGAA